jgi:hypothetical protein
MRVSGNVIKVRAIYVSQKIADGNLIPRIPDPGSSLTAFPEQEKCYQVQNDYNNELSKAQKEIRDHHKSTKIKHPRYG